MCPHTIITGTDEKKKKKHLVFLLFQNSRREFKLKPGFTVTEFSFTHNNLGFP